jgi:putative nucleotidyltransferase with HDIG domain
MIPTEEQAKQMLDTYAVPANKQKHLLLVSAVAKYLAEHLTRNNPSINVNRDLLVAATLLHDIDKGIEKLPGEQHPDAAVRVLTEEGMEEVARLVRNHPLHCINNPETAPKSWEEKILFLSDKMVKYEIITVDKRFDLWRNEELPEQGRAQLEMAYPKVKELEKELFSKSGLTSQNLTEFAQTVYTK